MGVTTGGTGSLDFAQGTKTANEPFIDGTVTWNAGGVAFKGINLAVTDTASAADSSLIDLLVGGTSRFRVYKPSSWSVLVADGTNSVPGIGGVGDPNTGITWPGSDVIDFISGGGVTARVRSTGIETGGTVGFLNLNGAGMFRWDAGTRLIQNANAVLRIDGNSNDTANVGLVLGGTTTSFPRLRANGAVLESRLADDSAYAPMVASRFGFSGITVVDLSGTGDPEGAITASVGSTFRRTDGGAATTLYIKESGAGNTGWVAVAVTGGTIGGSTGATNNAALRADGAGGATVQSSNLTIPDDAVATEVGYLNIPQNSQSADYTLLIADRGQHIFHPVGDNNPRTFTIPANASVAYPVGTAVTFVNKINVVTVAITSDTLTWAEDGSTGSRALAANGICTALKITTTEWLISGVGLS